MKRPTQLIIDAEKAELSQLRARLDAAHLLKEESAISYELRKRHNLDRALVDYLEAAIQEAEIKVQRAELQLLEESAHEKTEALLKEWSEERKRLD